MICIFKSPLQSKKISVGQTVETLTVISTVKIILSGCQAMIISIKMSCRYFGLNYEGDP